MFTPFERMMAFRYLRSRKAEGFVSVIAGFSFLGILLGVATLIIVMSVMNGFRQELIGRILGLNGHIGVYTSGPLTDFEPLAQRVAGVPGVTGVIPQIESQVLMNVHNVASGALVRGISKEDFLSKPILSESVVEGSVESFEGTTIAVGTAMAERLQIIPGDEVVLISPKAKTTPFGSMPTQRRYTVGLIFDVGMYEYDNGFIFMPLEAAQTFFRIPDAVTELEVFIDDPTRIDHLRKAVEMAVQGYAKIYDWRDSNKSFFNALQVERNVMFLILTLIILVAAFNIISSMIMLVKDKGRDIAIMRTMGATSSSMLKIFMLTGASIGFMGTFFGAVGGILFAKNIEPIRQWLESLTGTELFADEIYFLSQLPAVIDWHEVIAVIVMAFSLSILATFYPAWRAARLDPVEALRYE
ncbi:MAG: lipoprotein-releasing ABC transporter permease subunit [Alphaproteobacteria bacterium]|nr:lipoprotein-releasing ABC transporter permease subunit [Alphaproteobacteria bacterium]